MKSLTKIHHPLYVTNTLAEIEGTNIQIPLRDGGAPAHS